MILRISPLAGFWPRTGGYSACVSWRGLCECSKRSQGVSCRFSPLFSLRFRAIAVGPGHPVMFTLINNHWLTVLFLYGVVVKTCVFKLFFSSRCMISLRKKPKLAKTKKFVIFKNLHGTLVTEVKFLCICWGMNSVRCKHCFLFSALVKFAVM